MNKHKGFSVIELMIAMVLSLIVLGGLFTIFISNKQNFELQKGLSMIQQNSRFVIDALQKDIQNAGYMGCYSLGNMTTKNTLNVDPPPFESDYSEAIIGYEGTGSGWSPDASSLPADVRAMASQDNDIIVVRYSDGDSNLPLVKAMPNSSATIFVKENLVNPPIKDDDIVLITDCQKGAIFQITSYSNSSGGVQHNAGGSTLPGNKTKMLSDSGSYSTDAMLIKFQTVIYFVAPSSDENIRGETVNSLWKKVGASDPIELVQGISEFNVRYGEDRDADGIPNRYALATDVNDFEDVSSVSLDLVVNSVNKIENELMEKKFNSVFKIRNRGVQ